MKGSTVRKAVAAGILGAAAYVALVAYADGPRVLEALRRFPPQVVVQALALTSAAYALRALRWRLYLLRLPGRMPFGAGLATGVTSGKWGQVAKAAYLHRIGGVPLEASLPAGLAERVAETASLALLLGVGLAAAPGGDVRAGVAAASLVLVLVAALRSPLLPRVARAAAGRWPRLAAREARVEEGLAGLRGHLALRRLGPIALAGLPAFLLEALAFHVLAARGFGLPLGPAEAMLLVGLATAAGLLSMIPGGVLAVEGSLGALLVARGVPLADATALTLAFRACTLLWSLVLGGLALAYLERAARARGRPAEA